MCGEFTKAGTGTIVYDSIGDQWDADFQTDEESEFLEAFWKSERCAVFVDEAGDVLGQHDTYMRAVLTRGRHRGHTVHVISQRGAMLSPTVRDQCGVMYMFATSLRDCKIHANDWVCEELLKGHELKAGEYIRLERHAKPTRGNVFK